MPKRVLVVDDEQHICDLMDIWLSDDPRCDQVWTARDLDDAVRIAADQRPDAILLDFNVGRRTSIEVLPCLRASCPAALIVVHTANSDQARQANVEGLGADRIAEKATVAVADIVETLLG